MEQENIKHIKRDTKEIKNMLNRLNVIEGQVRGVKKMLEEDRYCVDILTQISSIQAALNGFNKQLLARHIKSCVCDDIRAGNDNAVDELCDLLKNLMK
ncbi:MAG: metal-sensing transcriptional repressor [Lachnospiraceae bacterium]